MIRKGAWIEVHTNILENNFCALTQHLKNISPTSEIMPVIKANAYGHGLQECAAIFVKQGASRLGVSCISEAHELRTSGLPSVKNTRIVSLTPPLKEDAEWFCKLNVEFVATSLEVVKKFSQVAEQHNICLNAHLYIDTGMRRDGIEPVDARSFMGECAKFSNIRMIGLCTHFAMSEDLRLDFTIAQLSIFRKIYTQLQSSGFYFRYVHAANSGAILQSPGSHFSLVRPGLLLYGYLPNKMISNKINVHPALSLKARIVSSRRVPRGESVGYGRQYFSKHDTTIVTIPIGYGDGLSLDYSRDLTCIIRGKRYYGAGMISMNHCMIDIGNDIIEIGDEVVLMGKQGNESIDAQDIAISRNTICYEVLSSLSLRIPRIFVSSP